MIYIGLRAQLDQLLQYLIESENKLNDELTAAKASVTSIQDDLKRVVLEYDRFKDMLVNYDKRYPDEQGS